MLYRLFTGFMFSFVTVAHGDCILDYRSAIDKERLDPSFFTAVQLNVENTFGSGPKPVLKLLHAVRGGYWNYQIVQDMLDNTKGFAKSDFGKRRKSEQTEIIEGMTSQSLLRVLKSALDRNLFCSNLKDFKRTRFNLATWDWIMRYSTYAMYLGEDFVQDLILKNSSGLYQFGKADLTSTLKAHVTDKFHQNRLARITSVVQNPQTTSCLLRFNNTYYDLYCNERLIDIDTFTTSSLLKPRIGVLKEILLLHFRPPTTDIDIGPITGRPWNEETYIR